MVVIKLCSCARQHHKYKAMTVTIVESNERVNAVHMEGLVRLCCWMS
jgi:hypothetical protein